MRWNPREALDGLVVEKAPQGDPMNHTCVRIAKGSRLDCNKCQKNL